MTVIAAVLAVTAGSATSTQAWEPGGAAIVAVTVDYVSASDLATPITELRANPNAPQSQWRLGLQVGYTCDLATPCEAASVAISPQPLDPFYGTQRFARYDSASLPEGATISGDEATGYTVLLGTLAPGSSGAFTLLYEWQGRRFDTPAPQSFFLDGTTITSTATIDATNAGALATASDSVTFRIGTPNPQVAIVPPELARANTDYTYTVRMAAGCMRSDTVIFGEPANLCAASYQNTLTLPPGATFVGASPDGTYDSVAHTVTWAASGQAAAPGWGTIDGTGHDRTVTVRFPDAMFTADCAIDVSINWATEVTYLDGQIKTASTEASHRASNCTPFTAVAPVSKTTSASVYDAGDDDHYLIRVGNRANVTGVAVIRDDDLLIPNLNVTRVAAPQGIIEYELDDGTTGSAVGTYTAPAGRRLASIVVTSPPLVGPNEQSNDQSRVTWYEVRLDYVTEGEAPPAGWTRDNTATAVMTYPDTGLADVDAGSSTATVTIRPRPAEFTTGITRTVPGGGVPSAGQPVNYTITARTADVRGGDTIEPQYFFVAPAQWSIVPNSWALAPGAPAGGIFDTKTVTLAGQTRQALYVHWPAGTVWGVNTDWPNLTVQATPTVAAPPGSSGIASSFIGDKSHSFTPATGFWNPIHFTDSTDIDGDGVFTDVFARANAFGVTVGANWGIVTTKEICRADAGAPGGCAWTSDTSTPVPVSPADGVRYRVTIRNTGSAALSNVVTYDVLPHPGDVGVSGARAAVPRGSQLAETIASVSGAPPALNLTYSASTNPCRPEVYAGGPAGCTSDWAADPVGKVAIRAAVSGTLAPGASVSFEYVAELVGGSAGERACNSIATAATSVSVSEPSPVCAEIDAPDMAIAAADRFPLQVGRVGRVPFVVTQTVGGPAAPVVSVSIPTGVSVGPLVPSNGWDCAAVATAGPTTVTCAPVNPDGTARELVNGVPETVAVPVVPSAAGSACFDATVAAGSADPTPDNAARACSAVVPAAGVSVTKDDAVTHVARGGQATYVITVANQLVGEAVNGAIVTDVLPGNATFVSAEPAATVSGTNPDGTGGALVWFLGNLAPAGVANGAGDGTSGGPGATRTVTVTVAIAPDASDTVTNTTTIVAPDPAGGVPLIGSATDVDLVPAAEVALVKTASPTTVTDIGQTITYTFLVLNGGDEPLADIVISDALDGLSAVRCPSTTLAPGATLECTATYAATADDFAAERIVNTATVVARPPSGAPISSDASRVIVPAIARPSMSLTKTASEPTFAAVGDVLHFEITATNTGNVAIDGLMVADHLPGSTAVACRSTALAPGSSTTCSATYTVGQADLDRGSVTNTATATGSVLGGVPVVSNTAVVTVVAAARPALTLTKRTAESSFAIAGTVVHYHFTAANTGNVTLHDLAIDDQLAGLSGIACPARSLPPGSTVTCTATYTATADDVNRGGIDNTATATARGAGGGTVTSTDTHRLDAVQQPALSLTKTVPAGQVLAADQPLTYTFEVTNAGNVELSNVTVLDPMPNLSPIDCRNQTVLAAGDTMQCTATYRVTADDVGRVDQLTNTASASGRAPGGGVVTSNSAVAAVPAVVAPQLTLAATGPTTPFTAAGTVLPFQFTVTNTGNVAVFGVAVDAALPRLGPVTCNATTLGPGASTACAAAYTTTQADVDSGGVRLTGAARARTASGTPVVSEADSYTAAAARTAAATFTKSSPTPWVAAAGDAVTFTFEVANTGSVSVTGVVVTDLLPGVSAVDCDGGTMLPGEHISCTATYRATQTDTDQGGVDNTATMTGESPAGPVSGTAEHRVPAVQTGDLFVDQTTVTHTFNRAGQVLVFGVGVGNAGNVTISDLALTSSLAGAVIKCPDDPSVVSRGEQLRCTVAYTATQADVDRGEVVSELTVSGTVPGRGTVTASAWASAQAQQSPGLTLVKSVAEAEFRVGSELNFSFAVTNTGNVTMVGVSVNDPMPRLSPVTCPRSTLAPGEAMTCTARYTATAADVAAGRISNTATAVAAPPGHGPIESEPSTASSPAAPTAPPQIPNAGTDITTLLALAALILSTGLALQAPTRRRPRPPGS